MATLATNLESFPKRVINDQNYVKIGEKRVKKHVNLKEGLPTPTTAPPRGLFHTMLSFEMT